MAKIRPPLTSSPSGYPRPGSERVSTRFRLIICIPSAPAAAQGAGLADQPEWPGPQTAATKAATGPGTPAVDSPHGGPNSPPLFDRTAEVKTANGPARKSLCHHDTVRDPVLDGAVVY